MFKKSDMSKKIYQSFSSYFKMALIFSRFALSFGLDAVKNREAVTALHREGILVAVNPVKTLN
jgi:cohesin complex subunit SA-1/2